MLGAAARPRRVIAINQEQELVIRAGPVPNTPEYARARRETRHVLVWYA